VNDATGRTLARGEGLLSVAACDPAERRAGQFTAELPAGAYQVSISVRGAGGRRGLFQARTALEPDPPGLSLSDLVLTCGNPGLLLGGQSARFDANVEAKVAASAPLVGYLEIYRLAPGPDGLSRYEWTCNVRRAPRENLAGSRGDRVDRAILVSTSREESHLGALRRQFVIVSVQSLPPGRYQLEVRVRDQVAGTVAERSAEFVRE